MVGRRKGTGPANGETNAVRGLGGSSARVSRREQAEADAELRRDLRWNWRAACSTTLLSQIVYTASGPGRSVPMIENIDLGPPVGLTVRMRPGQRIEDFLAAAPVIAPALGATGLEIIELAPSWVLIELVPAPVVGLRRRYTWTEPEAMKFGA